MTPASQAFEHLVRVAGEDARVLALWLDGSHGKGRAEPLSDYDVTLIIAEGGDAAAFGEGLIRGAPAGLDLRPHARGALEGG